MSNRRSYPNSTPWQRYCRGFWSGCASKNPQDRCSQWLRFASNLYGFRAGHHLIFYTPLPNGEILIVRILNERMDVNVIFAIRLWFSHHAPGNDGIFSEQLISFSKSPRTLQKCKCLINRLLTSRAVLDELKLVAPSTLPLARSACGGTQRGRWFSGTRRCGSQRPSVSPYPLIILANVL